jgi:hypothetical protein
LWASNAAAITAVVSGIAGLSNVTETASLVTVATNLSVLGTIAGNGSSLTNIGTNSLSAEAHEIYAAGLTNVVETDAMVTVATNLTVSGDNITLGTNIAIVPGYVTVGGGDNQQVLSVHRYVDVYAGDGTTYARLRAEASPILTVDNGIITGSIQVTNGITAASLSAPATYTDTLIASNSLIATNVVTSGLTNYGASGFLNNTYASSGKRHYLGAGYLVSAGTGVGVGYGGMFPAIDNNANYPLGSAALRFGSFHTMNLTAHSNAYFALPAYFTNTVTASNLVLSATSTNTPHILFSTNADVSLSRSTTNWLAVGDGTGQNTNGNLAVQLLSCSNLVFTSTNAPVFNGAGITNLPGTGIRAFAPTNRWDIYGDSNSIVDIAHGLGYTPNVVKWSLVCVTNEYDYSVGDCVPIEAEIGGARVWGANETNVFIQVNANGAGIVIYAKTSNQACGLQSDGGYWQLKVYAF